jgi:hypothetical protein
LRTLPGSANLHDTDERKGDMHLRGIGSMISHSFPFCIRPCLRHDVSPGDFVVDLPSILGYNKQAVACCSDMDFKRIMGD